MSAAGFSLAGRMTRLFLISTCLFVVVISGASAWFLERSVERELEALLVEELDELRAHLAGVDLAADVEQIEAVTAELGRMHTANPFAWRVWMPDSDEILGEFGALELLSPDVPAAAPLGRPLSGTGRLRWRTEQHPDGTRVGLVLDGTAQIALLRRYELFAGALILAGLLLTLGVSRVFFNRVSHILHAVAESARSVRSPSGEVELDLAGAPREVHEIVEALEEMLENLRREMAQAQIFTAGLAHELRSPVQNLVGTTEVALIAERSPAAYREVLQSHLDELHELGNAIDNLISICSAGSARQSSAREAFDLGEEADIRLHRERALAERRGIEFDLRMAGDLRLSGDREAILRALRNLVDNAIQWTDAGGRVEVVLTGLPDEVRVVVDDTGPGVPQELRQRIFEPFFHRSAAARPSTGARRLGYGLGLGMVRAALLNQGGDVEVDTSPGGGARFVALLPREAPPADAPSRDARRSA